MSDEPRFPSPEEARTAEGAYRAPAPRAEDRTSKKLVVTRAADPRDDEPPAVPKLSSEEIGAILAVDSVERPSPAQASLRRGKVIVIPTGLISLAAELLLGEAAPWVIVGVALLAIGWTARPLFRRDGWT